MDNQIASRIVALIFHLSQEQNLLWNFELLRIMTHTACRSSRDPSLGCLLFSFLCLDCLVSLPDFGAQQHLQFPFMRMVLALSSLAAVLLSLKLLNRFITTIRQKVVQYLPMKNYEQISQFATA